MRWDDVDQPRRRGNRYGEGPDFNLPQIRLPSLRRKNAVIILIVIAGLWYVLGSFYTVRPDQEGVVLRLGKRLRSTGPGPHWRHFPWPIETVEKPKVTEMKRAEIGFRTIDPGPPARYASVPNESLMLTGDLNIVDIDIVVQYWIVDAAKYLFNVRDPLGTVRDAAEAALREVIGKRKIDEALTTGKDEIQLETRDQLQQILDQYGCGLRVNAVQLQDAHPPQDVIDAFKDVANAIEDKDRLINEAEGYRNAIIPEAEGRVAKILQAAEAYKREREKRAAGDAERFNAVLAEYKKAKDITRKRLYLETIESILPNMEKVIVEEGLPAPLPLLQMGRRATETAVVE